MLKPLSEQQETYVRFFKDWECCPDLTSVELNLVTELRKAAEENLAVLDVTREVVRKNFFKELQSAIQKGRRYGIGKEAKQYA